MNFIPTQISVQYSDTKQHHSISCIHINKADHKWNIYDYTYIRYGYKSKLPLREVTVRSNSDLALLPGYSDSVTKSTSLATNLDPLLEKLLQGCNVHDLVLHWLRTVNSKRDSLLLPLGNWCTSSTHLRLSSIIHTK